MSSLKEENKKGYKTIYELIEIQKQKDKLFGEAQFNKIQKDKKSKNETYLGHHSPKHKDPKLPKKPNWGKDKGPFFSEHHFTQLEHN